MVAKIKQEIKKKSWFRRHWILTIILIIVILGVIGIIVPKEDNSNTGGLKMINSNTGDSNAQETKTYNVGDTIKAGDFEWKIMGFTTASEVGEEIMGSLLGEKANGIYLIISVEVTNIGKSANYLSDFYMKLIDEQGREFSADTVAAVYLKPSGSAMIFETINPGITKKGKIVYDVPEGLKFVNARISSNLLSSSFYNVKLAI